MVASVSPPPPLPPPKLSKLGKWFLTDGLIKPHFEDYILPRPLD